MFGKYHHGVCRLKNLSSEQSNRDSWKNNSSKPDVRQMSEQIQFLMKERTKRNKKKQ
tara:strand:+ start:208 stop:378 length:171 start_codon:yes stop_codon:yes gene_type:complete